MTHEEVRVMIRELRRVFDVVRIVEPQSDKHASTLEPSKKQLSRRFELLGAEVYLVTEMCVEIEGKPFEIEMLAKLTDETMLGTWGANDFAEAIIKYNRRLYLDALTGAYNRQYYEEHLAALSGEYAVGYIDLDKLKDINDTWGHNAGDQALKAVVSTMQSCVRDTDSVVRFGGDEFVLVFRNIPKDLFALRLEKIRKAVSEAVFEDFPDMRLSISVGGYYGEGAMGELVQKADALLYEAKPSRNSVRLNFEA